MKYIALLSLVSCATVQPRLMRWRDGTAARLCESDRLVIFVAVTNEDLVDRTREAAELWNEWLGHDLFIVTDKATVIMGGEAWVSLDEQPLGNPAWRGIAQLQGRTGNCGEYGSISIAPVSRELIDLQITAIIAHELGHLLGLQHTPFASDLMWPHIHTSKTVLFRVPPPADEQLEWARNAWRKDK